jgi:hypothetical protein
MVGWLRADYGNLTHGYCVTSYSAQSKGVDCVFVAESSESFRAADREQFYVSASRFKEALTIYTDDKGALLDAVNKTSQRPSATDLVKQQMGVERPSEQSQAPAPNLPKEGVPVGDQTCEKPLAGRTADAAPLGNEQPTDDAVPAISPRHRVRQQIRHSAPQQSQSYGMGM